MHIRGEVASLALGLILSVVLSLSMLPMFSSQAHAEESNAAPLSGRAAISYSQADGYEAYQGWQNSPWDEASDPWYSSSGGTTRKGYPAWSLADPLSIGVTGYDGGMVTGDTVTVVADTNKTDTTGTGSFADPFFYKNVILQPYDVSQDSIQFMFNYVGAGGVNLAYTLDPNTPSGFIIAKSADPKDWNSSDDPKNWVASDSVVWEATTQNTIVQNTSDNWWKNITCTVDTSCLEANQTYYLAIKNGTAGQWGRVYADIVFEFSTDMNRDAVWDGDLSSSGYGREQGNGGTKLGLMSPDPSDVTIDLGAIATCWDNTVATPMSFNDDNAIVFKVHADGSGSNWQTISSWTNNSEIKVYDVDPVGTDGYNVEGVEPIATIANGSISCSLANPDRDWPSVDGVSIAVSDLEANKSYWLVFTESFLPGNATNPLKKPVVFGFKTSAAASQDFTALNAAIVDAETIAADAVASEDGKDVGNGATYVTAEGLKAFMDALASAKGVSAKSDATQEEINAAVAALGLAKTVYNDALKTAVTGYDDLNDSLAAAAAIKGSVRASIDGSDVSAGANWVTQAAIDQLQAVIDAQGAVASNNTATQNQVDAAQAAVDAAVEAFNNALNTASPSTVALSAALAVARAAVDEPRISSDGRDVPHGKTWCMDSDRQTLNGAIDASQDVVDAVLAASRSRAAADTSQNGVDASLAALNEALSSFNASIKTAAVDGDELLAALSKGNDALVATSISVDGTDVFVRNQWVTQTQSDAYKNVLLAAQRTAQDASRTQNGVDAALADLNAATALFEAAKQAGLKVDTSLLSSALEEAAGDAAGVEVADNAGAVPSGTVFVTQQASDAYRAAVAKAKAVLGNVNATQDEVDAAVRDLADAKSVFQAAKQVGTGGQSPDGPAVDQSGSGSAPDAAAKPLARTGDQAARSVVVGVLGCCAALGMVLLARRRMRS